MSAYKIDDWKDFRLEDVQRLQQHLIYWFERNHRKLPWRETRNPYYIWISEVMLQQTRVDTVIPYFLRFIDAFPMIESLAAAEEEEVLQLWAGLGYYSRARNIHRGAKFICEIYNGKIPEARKELLKVHGIGPYTAGAILSIAYGKAAAAVDGNVMRVFSRLFLIYEDISEAGTRKMMERLGETVVSVENPSAFNQGLMELGAMICTPSSPKCLLCPLLLICKARKEGVQETLPLKKKKEPVKLLNMELALLQKEDKILLTKRPAEGLLANLWALPSTEEMIGNAPGKSIVMELQENYGIKTAQPQADIQKSHIFTHMKWNMQLFRLKLISMSDIDYPEIQWVSLNEIGKYAIPTAFLKVIKEIKI
ncbi:A/G-specific adenine glycosylase [Geosporobacter ferrireducens]|uniref:Adenine DNA glycosylase n=1 Tax=Geosporobacter ferrireducens TaxID=1424294 RepID=A0A1D8GLE0_9FIRM|nr:A/G-specific adenine glycosylase [Geosporobacter ferrireducens]AOT71724.1 A/G-specific adenine glycosylase [Geosporobacter ferrireducens]